MSGHSRDESWDEVGLPADWRLVVLDETDSTNDEVRRRGDLNVAILAERQLAGRGRRGAVWLSRAGEGLTFSVMIDPREPCALWPRLSLAAGVAVAESLETLGLAAEIKWPNDVLVGGRKLAGILVEAADKGAIIGIGVNVATSGFPGELAASATSMELERGAGVSRTALLELLLESLAGWSARIGPGFPQVVARVRERCALSGRRVRLLVRGQQVEGTALRVSNSGELVVEVDGEVRRFLQADEVRVVE